MRNAECEMIEEANAEYRMGNSELTEAPESVAFHSAFRIPHSALVM